MTSPLSNQYNSIEKWNRWVPVEDTKNQINKLFVEHVSKESKTLPKQPVPNSCQQAVTSEQADLFEKTIWNRPFDIEPVSGSNNPTIKHKLGSFITGLYNYLLQNGSFTTVSIDGSAVRAIYNNDLPALEDLIDVDISFKVNHTLEEFKKIRQYLLGYLQTQGAWNAYDYLQKQFSSLAVPEAKGYWCFYTVGSATKNKISCDLKFVLSNKRTYVHYSDSLQLILPIGQKELSKALMFSTSKGLALSTVTRDIKGRLLRGCHVENCFRGFLKYYGEQLFKDYQDAEIDLESHHIKKALIDVKEGELAATVDAYVGDHSKDKDFALPLYMLSMMAGAYLRLDNAVWTKRVAELFPHLKEHPSYPPYLKKLINTLTLHPDKAYQTISLWYIDALLALLAKTHLFENDNISLMQNQAYYHIRLKLGPHALFLPGLAPKAFSLESRKIDGLIKAIMHVSARESDKIVYARALFKIIVYAQPSRLLKNSSTIPHFLMPNDADQDISITSLFQDAACQQRPSWQRVVESAEFYRYAKDSFTYDLYALAKTLIIYRLKREALIVLSLHKKRHPHIDVSSEVFTILFYLTSQKFHAKSSQINAFILETARIALGLTESALPIKLSGEEAYDLLLDDLLVHSDKSLIQSFLNSLKTLFAWGGTARALAQFIHAVMLQYSLNASEALYFYEKYTAAPNDEYLNYVENHLSQPMCRNLLNKLKNYTVADHLKEKVSRILLKALANKVLSEKEIEESPFTGSEELTQKLFFIEVSHNALDQARHLYQKLQDKGPIIDGLYRLFVSSDHNGPLQIISEIVSDDQIYDLVEKDCQQPTLHLILRLIPLLGHNKISPHLTGPWFDSQSSSLEKASKELKLAFVECALLYGQSTLEKSLLWVTMDRAIAHFAKSKSERFICLAKEQLAKNLPLLSKISQETLQLVSGYPSPWDSDIFLQRNPKLTGEVIDELESFVKSDKNKAHMPLYCEYITSQIGLLDSGWIISHIKSLRSIIGLLKDQRQNTTQLEAYCIQKNIPIIDQKQTRKKIDTTLSLYYANNSSDRAKRFVTKNHTPAVGGYLKENLLKTGSDFYADLLIHYIDICKESYHFFEGSKGSDNITLFTYILLAYGRATLVKEAREFLTHGLIDNEWVLPLPTLLKMVNWEKADDSVFLGSMLQTAFSSLIAECTAQPTWLQPYLKVLFESDLENHQAIIPQHIDKLADSPFVCNNTITQEVLTLFEYHSKETLQAATINVKLALANTDMDFLILLYKSTLRLLIRSVKERREIDFYDKIAFTNGISLYLIAAFTNIDMLFRIQLPSSTTQQEVKWLEAEFLDLFDKLVVDTVADQTKLVNRTMNKHPHKIRALSKQISLNINTVISLDEITSATSHFIKVIETIRSLYLQHYHQYIKENGMDAKSYSHLVHLMEMRFSCEQLDKVKEFFPVILKLPLSPTIFYFFESISDYLESEEFIPMNLDHALVLFFKNFTKSINSALLQRTPKDLATWHSSSNQIIDIYKSFWIASDECTCNKDFIVSQLSIYSKHLFKSLYLKADITSDFDLIVLLFDFILMYFCRSKDPNTSEIIQEIVIPSLTILMKIPERSGHFYYSLCSFSKRIDPEDGSALLALSKQVSDNITEKLFVAFSKKLPFTAAHYHNHPMPYSIEISLAVDASKPFAVEAFWRYLLYLLMHKSDQNVVDKITVLMNQMPPDDLYNLVSTTPAFLLSLLAAPRNTLLSATILRYIGLVPIDHPEQISYEDISHFTFYLLKTHFLVKDTQVITFFDLKKLHLVLACTTRLLDLYSPKNQPAPLLIQVFEKTATILTASDKENKEWIVKIMDIISENLPTPRFVITSTAPEKILQEQMDNQQTTDLLLNILTNMLKLTIKYNNTTSQQHCYIYVSNWLAMPLPIDIFRKVVELQIHHLEEAQSHKSLVTIP